MWAVRQAAVLQSVPSPQLMRFAFTRRDADLATTWLGPGFDRIPII